MTDKKSTYKLVIDTTLSSMVTQIRLSSLVLSILYIGVFLLLISLYIVSEMTGIPVEHFTRDVAAINKTSPFIGFLSNIGILLWCITASICWTKLYLQINQLSRFKQLFWFYSGLLSAVLLIDDLFMLHEHILPKKLFIPELIVYLLYIGSVSLYLIVFRRIILSLDYAIMGLALGFLGLSVISDMVLPQVGLEFLFEDGLKIMGIVSWTYFYIKSLKVSD